MHNIFSRPDRRDEGVSSTTPCTLPRYAPRANLQRKLEKGSRVRPWAEELMAGLGSEGVLAALGAEDEDEKARRKSH
jgi:hypothetical protein